MLAAFDAVQAGTATSNQHALVEAAIDTFRSKLTETPLLTAVTDAIGPLAEISTKAFSELNELQRWVRSQQHGADQVRENPALRDMHSVYELLVTTASRSGAAIRLAPGCNVVALDESRRRFLIPSIKKDVLDEIRAAKSVHAANRAARRKGVVQYHWSVERTGLVPSPDEITEVLPLPENGAYLVLYAAPVNVVSKPAFNRAVETLASRVDLLDVLVWDTTAAPPTLWSLRGGFGHSAGDDVEWEVEHQQHAKSLQAALVSEDIADSAS
jgi:hypothetical protein